MTSTHQQSLADVGSETRPPMLERGSYVPWASRFMRYIERKMDTRKFLKHLIKKDIEAMNLILLSIPNDIYNSVDACENARDMWDRVKRLMHGIKLSTTKRESMFLNDFDKFTFEAGQSLSFVYNRFSQLINDLGRNKVKPITMAMNTKRCAYL
ncbi:hypothetical protein Tco_0017841 [Tanacetum coccineum]